MLAVPLEWSVYFHAFDLLYTLLSEPFFPLKLCELMAASLTRHRGEVSLYLLLEATLKNTLTWHKERFQQ